MAQDGHHASVCTETSKLIPQLGNLTYVPWSFLNYDWEEVQRTISSHGKEIHKHKLELVTAGSGQAEQGSELSPSLSARCHSFLKLFIQRSHSKFFILAKKLIFFSKCYLLYISKHLSAHNFVCCLNFMVELAVNF